jgi:hypothetical protein
MLVMQQCYAFSVAIISRTWSLGLYLHLLASIYIKSVTIWATPGCIHYGILCHLRTKWNVRDLPEFLQHSRLCFLSGVNGSVANRFVTESAWRLHPRGWHHSDLCGLEFPILALGLKMTDLLNEMFDMILSNASHTWHFKLYSLIQVLALFISQIGC